MGEWRSAAYDCARRLLELYEGTLLPRGPFAPQGHYLIGEESLTSEPADLVVQVMLQFVLAPCDWYLRQLLSLSQPDQELVQRVVDDLLRVASTGEFLVRQSVPIVGITADGELSDGPRRIRELTPLERAELIRPRRMGRTPVSMAAMIDAVSIADFVLEVDTPCRALNRFNQIPPPTALITALELQEVWVLGPGAVAYHVIPEWLGTGRAANPMPMRRLHQGGRVPISQEQFERASATADKIKEDQPDSPRGAAKLALDRFHLGCSRPDLTDALVDFVVVLEALLLPDDDSIQRGEMMGYRFRLHGAHFIADNVVDRHGVHDQLKEIYNARSRLVHGGKAKPSDVGKTTETARSLAARGLLKAVTVGFPDAAYFRRALLGEPEDT